MAKGILISYAGYPYTPSSFLPDNGLANLAGALIQNGHRALILDFGTVDVIKRLMPKDIRIALKDIYAEAKRLKEKKGLSRLKKMFLFHRLKQIDKTLARYQHNQVLVMARELIDLIKDQKPDFVGFKLWLGDGFAGSVKMAEMVKRAFPHMKIFGGGPVVDEGEETILEITSVFDVLNYGDGEETIIDLALYCEGEKDITTIPNLIYKKDGNHIVKTERRIIDDLDNLPLPVYDREVYPAMRDNQKIKIIMLDESRGCPYRCYFCPHVYKSGGRWRVKSPQRITREIKRLVEYYHIHAFRYAGSCTPSQTMKAVANNILTDKLDVTYTSFAHVKTTDIKNLEILKRSGLHALFFGIESGDDRILHEIMNKRMFSAKVTKNIIKTAIDAGIFCVGSIIFPAPSEDLQSRQKTLDLLKEIYKNPESGAVEVQFPGLFPATEWYRDPTRFGFKIKNPKTYKQDMFTYKIKLFFPPSFWEPVPYTIDGKSHRQFTKETENLVKELEENNILTDMTDELALAARLLGMTPKQYRDNSRLQLLTGDWESIAKDIQTINYGITSDEGIRADIRRSRF